MTKEQTQTKCRLSDFIHPVSKEIEEKNQARNNHLRKWQWSSYDSKQRKNIRAALCWNKTYQSWPGSITTLIFKYSFEVRKQH